MRGGSTAAPLAPLAALSKDALPCRALRSTPCRSLPQGALWDAALIGAVFLKAQRAGSGSFLHARKHFPHLQQFRIISGILGGEFE